MNRLPLVAALALGALVLVITAAGVTLRLAGGPAETQAPASGVRVVTVSEGPSLTGTLAGPGAEAAILELFRVREGAPERTPVAVAQLGAGGSFRFLSLRPGPYLLVSSSGPRRRIDLPAEGETRIRLG